MPEKDVTGSTAKRAAQLADGLAALQLDLGVDQQQQLLDYLQLLYQWNRAYNLTSIPDNDSTVALQLLDSLVLLPDLPAHCRLLDIGSGGGLPGVPLAIARPSMAVTLLDSNGKKTRFLQQVKLELRLNNVQVVQARIEQWCATVADAKDLYICSRAFTDLAQMLDWTLPLVRSGATLLALKGQYPQAELDALQRVAEFAALQCSCESLQVPGVAAARHLVTIKA